MNTKMEIKTTTCAAVLLLSAGLAAGCKDGTAPREVPAVSVTTLHAEARPAGGSLSFSGTVEESDGTTLSFMTAGTLRRLLVETGQRVSRGQLIGEVDATTQRNAHEAALAARNQAEDACRRLRLLYDNKSLPEIQWVEAQSTLKQAVAAEKIARKVLADTRLYAPCSGYVSVRLAEEGQNVMPGVPVVKIVQIDRVKIKVAVPENEIAGIGKGQQASISVPALGGRRFKGVVTEKEVTANPLSRSYTVKITVGNADHALLPGMVCDAVVGGGAQRPDSVIVVPAEVVGVDDRNRNFVWVSVGGKARKRTVTIGRQTPEGVVVSAGLRSGDDVIADGRQNVSEGMSVSHRN